MDCHLSYIDVVNLVIYCLSCNERILALDAYCKFLDQNEIRYSSSVRAVYDMHQCHWILTARHRHKHEVSLALYQIIWNWAIVWDLWITAKCRDDWIVRLVTQCQFKNGPLYLNFVGNATIAVLHVSWLKLYSTAFMTFYCGTRCELIFLLYIWRYTVF